MSSNPHILGKDRDSMSESSAELPDMSIVCLDCNQEFIWTTGERTFFHQKGLTTPPKRCKPCKKAKNDRVEAAIAASNVLLADAKRPFHSTLLRAGRSFAGSVSANSSPAPFFHLSSTSAAICVRIRSAANSNSMKAEESVRWR